MTDLSPRLGLRFLAANQGQPEATVNEGLSRLDLLVQASVLDRDLTAPPGSPAQGAAYLVADSPTGAWAGKAGQIAAWYGTAWVFIEPWPGMIVYVVDEALSLIRGAGDWGSLAGAGGTAIADVSGLTAALAEKAPLASSTFTGQVGVPDGSAGTPAVRFGGGMGLFATSTTIQAALSTGYVTGSWGAASMTLFRDASPPRYGLTRTDAHGAGATIGEVWATGLDAAASNITYATIRGIAVANGAGATEGRWLFRTRVAGTDADRVQIDSAGISVSGANPVISLDRLHILRVLTIATLSSVTPVAGALVDVSDLGGGRGMVEYNGAIWVRMREEGAQTISSNADLTLAYLTNAPVIYHAGTLTADRAVTLPTSNVANGARFHFVRVGAGAFNLNIGASVTRALITNTWCVAEYDGGAWHIISAGSL